MVARVARLGADMNIALDDPAKLAREVAIELRKRGIWAQISDGERGDK